MIYGQDAVKTETLNRQSPIPLYYQLKEILRSWITSGKFDSDGCFPPERKLQERYGISRMTVRRALAELVNEGFLIREQGRGSFVVKTRMQEQLRHLTSFTEDTEQRGLSSEAKVLDFQITVDTEVAEEMGISEDEELIRLQRIRMVEGEPLALQTSFIRHNLCPGLVEQGLLGESLYKTLEAGYGLRLGRARQTFEAKPADEYEAGLLGIDVGQSVLVLERLTYLHNGTPIEYVRSTYRGDRYRFTVELLR